jgi:hypothetical protein
MSRWEETLDQLLDLWKFSNSPTGKNYYEGFAESVLKARDTSSPELFKRLYPMLKSMLLTADPIYIDKDMMRLGEAAGQTFELESFLPTDVITPSGFMVFPYSLRIPDIHDKDVSYKAVLWHTIDINLETPEREEPYPVQGLAIMVFHHVGDRDDYDEDYRNAVLFRGTSNRLILTHAQIWPFAKYEGEKIHTDIKNIQRPIAALWRLMSQTISVATKAYAPRAFRERWVRENLTPKPITVITLRRPKVTRDGVTREVEWSHRWLVEGHWRNQWYPSLEAHRQIWISPYIKGPEDKELELRKIRVFEFVR